MNLAETDFLKILVLYLATETRGKKNEIKNGRAKEEYNEAEVMEDCF